MGTVANSVRAAILGAAAMYWIDPVRGKRRRALARDKAMRLANQTRRGWEKALRDLANRRKGLAAVAASRIPFRSRRAPDYILEARVRSLLGRLVSHPHAIDVLARGGEITVSGDILSSEAGRLLRGVSGVAGVSKVTDALRRHDNPERLPSLQGGRKRQPQFELLQENWSPATRLITAAAGGALAIYGLWKGGIAGGAAGVAGVGLLARSTTNRDLNHLLGVQPGHPGFSIHKTVHVAAPVETVYEFWSNYENFPRFMPHLREVRETGPGHSHWIARGPAGVTAEWDAEITELVPKEVLAWRTMPGSAIDMKGRIRFEPEGDNNTRLSIQVSYQPPAGAAGHVMAMLFGADPKQAMDEDLVRLKSLLEGGKTRAHGEVIARSNLPLPPKPLIMAPPSPFIH